MITSWLDSLLHRQRLGAAVPATWPAGTRLLHLPGGVVRVQDTGGHHPVLVMVPDGPCVIEHYQELMRRLAAHFRVVCFDMPGFGFSAPSSVYNHRLDAGAAVVLEVLEALNVRRAALAFSCANGFYAMKAAEKAPDRITHLVLAQTPSLEGMRQWTQRVIPRAIRLPVLGQILGRAMQQQLATQWYRSALPKATDPMPFQQVSVRAFGSGGCFCLAGIVQGMLREDHHTALAQVQVPTTVVWGSLDRTHRPTNPTSVRTHAPSAKVVLFDDCAHFPNLEQPARFADLLRTTLL